MDLEKIVAQAKKGEREAQSALYQQYFQKIYSLALGITDPWPWASPKTRKTPWTSARKPFYLPFSSCPPCGKVQPSPTGYARSPQTNAAVW